MKHSRFTTTRIIQILNEQQQGLTVEEICRKHNIASSTFYKWKTKFDALSVSEAKRLHSNWLNQLKDFLHPFILYPLKNTLIVDEN